MNNHYCHFDSHDGSSDVCCYKDGREFVTVTRRNRENVYTGRAVSGQYDGVVFVDTTLTGLLARIIGLRASGYIVSDSVLATIREEIAEEEGSEG